MQNDNWPKPRHPKAREFGHISDAYDYARENNKPIVVRLPDTPAMANRLVKLYPSGSYVGIYSYSTSWQGGRSYAIRGGELLDKDADIAKAIARVGNWASEQEQRAGDEKRWATIIRECQADLPAEKID